MGRWFGSLEDRQKINSSYRAVILHEENMAESTEILMHAPGKTYSIRNIMRLVSEKGDLKNWCLLPHMCPTHEYQHEGTLAGRIISQIL